MLGRSISDIYDPRRHIYRGAKHRGKYAAEVVYRGYGPTYCIIYTIYYGECATDEPFAWKCFAKWHHFCPKSISDICDHFAILKFLWLLNHHGTYVYISSPDCETNYFFCIQRPILRFAIFCSRLISHAYKWYSSDPCAILSLVCLFMCLLVGS